MLTRAPLADSPRVTVDVARLMRDRAAHWSDLARERDVEIVTAIPAHSEATAAPGAVEQIIDNFVDNALDVAPRGSTITLSVVAERDQVVLRVTDEGPGLSDPERLKAFEGFWRGPSSGSGGIGIGLTIARDLATASGGQVVLLPNVGGGTRAALTLEAGRLAAARSGEASAVAALYADVHPSLRRYLRALAPERAETIERGVWGEAARQLRVFDGTEEKFRAVMFGLAHDSLHRKPVMGPGSDAEHREGSGRSRPRDVAGRPVVDDLSQATRIVVEVLPQREAEVVLLRCMAGLDGGETAHTTGWSERSVIRLERRAMRRLRRYLSRPGVGV